MLGDSPSTPRCKSAIGTHMAVRIRLARHCVTSAVSDCRTPIARCGHTTGASERLHRNLELKMYLATVALFIFAAAWHNSSFAGEGAESRDAPSDDVAAEGRRRTVEGRPALQMSSDFGSPALAIASYRPVGEVEARGIRVAPFTIRAAAITGIGYDDNVALAPVNKTSSLFLSFAPSIVIGLEGTTQRYYGVYRGNYGRYTSSSMDNYDDHNFGLIAANEWTTRLRSQASYDFVRGHNPRGYNITAVTEPDRWDWHSLRGAVSYGAEGAKGRIEGAAAVSSRRYLANNAANAGRDYDQTDLGGTFSYRLAPKTRGLLQIAHSDITHDADRSLDSSEMRYTAGVTWEALAKTRGTLRAGLVTKDFSSAARRDFTGPTYEAAVTWSPRTYSIVTLTARRTISETSEVGTTFGVSDTVALSWAHEWSERTRSSFTYVHDQQALRGFDRDDTYQNIGVRTSYALRRWLRIAVDVRHDRRESTLPGIDYRRNLMLVSVESAL